MSRFKDPGDLVYSFGDELLVRCPRCGRSAHLSFCTTHERVATQRFVCEHCGNSDERTVQGIPPFDHESNWPVPRSLWLQAPCCGHNLWALNERHLSYLEEYVSAELRERRQNPKYGWKNQSLAGRLPRWLTAAKHRDEVLKCIRRIRDEQLNAR